MGQLTMDCLTESLSIRLLGGAVTAEERTAIEGHLIRCEGCCRMLAEAARDSMTPETAWLERLRPPQLAPGTVVADRYQIVRALGSGAMGEVYESEDRLLGKIVALKTLNASLTGRPGAIARLKSEVAIAHRVTHPGVCRIFDFGVDEQPDPGSGGQVVFLTMEYLRGETVAAFLRRGTPPTTQTLSLLTQIASGLAAAHDVGVVHRDLKPENVMLVEHAERGLRAVITDFGLAGSFATDLPPPGTTRAFSGTVVYAAPERLAGRSATPASDVYSFGLVAQQLLTGKLPAMASTAAVAAAIRLGERLEGDPVAASGLGPAWDRFVLKTLHPDPAQRYRNGGELVEAIRTLSPDAVARAPRRWRRAVVAIGGAVVLAVVAAATRGPDAPRAAPLPTAAERPAAAGAPSAAPPPPAPAPVLPAETPAPPAVGRTEEKRSGDLTRPRRKATRREGLASLPAPADRPAAASSAPAAVEHQKPAPAPDSTSDLELADPFARGRQPTLEQP